MMLKLILRLRSLAFSGFGAAEHVCAFGYALSEFRVHIAETILIGGSSVLMVCAVTVALDAGIGRWRARQKRVS